MGRASPSTITGVPLDGLFAELSFETARSIRKSRWNLAATDHKVYTNDRASPFSARAAAFPTKRIIVFPLSSVLSSKTARTGAKSSEIHSLFAVAAKVRSYSPASPRKSNGNMRSAKAKNVRLAKPQNRCELGSAPQLS